MEATAIARLFSSSVYRELAQRGRSRIFARLVRTASEFAADLSDHTVAGFFEAAFSILKRKANRHEYVYKSALTHKVLLGAHSLRTAAMLTEFRVDARKADVVILNGSGTVYEIKSERDSLLRLRDQVETFKLVFPAVNVVVGENHLAETLQIVSPDVGVLSLSSRYQISRVREANPIFERLSPTMIFRSMTMREAELILLDLGVPVPKTPNTQRHNLLASLFQQLEPPAAHEAMVRVLKKTRSLITLSRLVAELPPSLHTVALSTKIRKQDHDRLISAVHAPMEQALRWD